MTDLKPYPDAAPNWPLVVGRTWGRVLGRRDRIAAGLGEMNQGNLLSVLVKIGSLARSLLGTRAGHLAFGGRRQADPAREGEVP
jgi:hypothetical protein